MSAPGPGHSAGAGSGAQDAAQVERELDPCNRRLNGLRCVLDEDHAEGCEDMFGDTDEDLDD